MADPGTEFLQAMVQRVLDTQGQTMDRLDALSERVGAIGEIGVGNWGQSGILRDAVLWFPTT